MSTREDVQLALRLLDHATDLLLQTAASEGFTEAELTALSERLRTLDGMPRAHDRQRALEARAAILRGHAPPGPEPDPLLG